MMNARARSSVILWFFYADMTLYIFLIKTGEINQALIFPY